MASRVLFERHGVRRPGFFEISWKRWSLAFEVIYSGDGDGDRWPWMLHVHFLLLNLFLHFPLALVPPSKRERWMNEWQHWGFSLCDDSFQFSWGECTKVCWLPWFNKVHQRHEIRRADGSWVPYVGSYEQGKEPDGRETFVFPYAYRLRNDELQQRMATVYVERRAWRPRGFEWTRLFEKVRQSISVEFDGEVGERSGSWKGGCIGCGYSMLPNETPKQTLRRMERERTFA